MNKWLSLALLGMFAPLGLEAKIKVFTKDIGVPHSNVPLTHACIDPQVVFGTNTTVHYGSAVEPSIAVNPVNPSNIVTVWQQDRITNGGALEAQIAYTLNGGRNWKHTTVPIQICTGGIAQRVSDVWLSFAPDGSKVYLCGLAFNATFNAASPTQNGVFVTTSTDGGASWSTPAIVNTFTLSYLNEPTGQYPFPDKTSVTANPNRNDTAYVVWEEFPFTANEGDHADTLMSRTFDGGQTWSLPSLVYNPFPDLVATGLSNNIWNDNQTIGNVIVVLPEDKDGKKSDQISGNHREKTVINFMTRIYATPGATTDEYFNDSFPYQFTLQDFALVRSKDGICFETSAIVIASESFNATAVFTGGYTYDSNGNITGGVGTLLRTGDFIAQFAVNPSNGNLYAVWQSSRFRPDQLDQIALSTSRDGGETWSQPVRVNKTPQNAANPQAFTPFVAVTAEGKVGIIYNDFRKNEVLFSPQTKTDEWFVLYQEVEDLQGGNTGIGLDFVKEVRLSECSYIAENGPTTSQGVMTNGDYSFLTASKETFYAAYTKSFKGPFTAPAVFFRDAQTGSAVLVDNNHRTDTFASIIKINC
jgi:hypothetical protein